MLESDAWSVCFISVIIIVVVAVIIIIPQRQMQHKKLNDGKITEHEVK